MQNKRLKIGIIGFGRMGQQYVHELLQHPLWQLAYICDTGQAARQMAAELVPHIPVTADEDVLFDDPSIDVVGLFTLADARKAQILKAIRKHKHILAEKPIAENIADEWDILQQVEASNLRMAVNLFNRNAWYHKEMISFIRSGEIGQPAIIRIAHMTPGHMPQEGHEAEGPAFHDCGMHYVDVARWYADSEFNTFHAQGMRMWSYEEPWWVQVHGTFRNGIVFDITQGFVYGQLAKDKTHNCYVDVIGTQGIARLTYDFKTASIDMHGVNRTIRRTEPFGDKKIDILVDVFARSILSGTNLGYPTVKDSVIASDMAWQMLADAKLNDLPCIGQPEEMDAIIAHRRTLTEGYGLPLWDIIDEQQSKD